MEDLGLHVDCGFKFTVFKNTLLKSVLQEAGKKTTDTICEEFVARPFKG